MPREMGGLKESQNAFKKHHIEVGNALLNISGVGTADGEPKDKDDPRPAYIPQQFPKMIFHAEKGELVVEHQEELDLHLKRGYRLEPYPKPQVAIEDPKVEKAALQAQLKKKDGEIASLADTLQRAIARLDALELSKAEEKSRIK